MKSTHNRKTPLLLSVIVVFILAIIGTYLFLPFPSSQLSSDVIASTSLDPIKIGIIYPLSGQLAFAESMKNAAQLAVEDINTDGGIHGQELALVIEDGQADPLKSIAAFNKLYEINHVHYFITTTSKVGIPLKSMVKDKDVVLFSDIGHPYAITNTTNVLRHSQSIEQETALLFDIINKNNYSSVCLLTTNDEYGSAYLSELKEYFPDLCYEQIDLQATDFRTNIIKLQHISPDVIVVAGAGKNLGLAVRQLKESGYTKNIIGSLGLILVPGTVEIIGNMSGICYIAFDDALLSPDFTIHYTERFGSAPTLYAVISYTDIELLATALRETGDSPTEVVSYIKNKGVFTGTYEHTTITSEGNIFPPLELVCVP